MKYPPQLTEKHFLAMIGLSEAKVWDEIIKTHVPFSLSDAERSFLIEEEITEFRWSDALDKAEAFFKDKSPSGKIYFKKNRTSSSGKLYVTSFFKNQNDFMLGVRGQIGGQSHQHNM